MRTAPQLRVLKTKLTPPASASPPIARPRLLDTVSDLDRVRLVLVSGPAGAGKSTALLQLYSRLADQGTAVAWLSLDSFDNEPQRFLAHLTATVMSLGTPLGRAAAELLATEPNTPFADVVTSLINDLLVAGTTPTAICLDDYQEIQEPSIHRGVAMLLKYIPRNVTVMIGSRSEPPLQLSRMRARGRLMQLSWPDLRFTVEETGRYLREVRDLSLPDDRVRKLCDNTEGWITGIQLAAATVADLCAPEAAGAKISAEDAAGAPVDTADYLLEEVFRRQSGETKEFLLRTAVLDRMNASLCQAVTGLREAQSRLEGLERRHLLIFRLDEARNWFRYHHLFSEFLLARLHAEKPDEVAPLYGRASEWFERHGPVSEAVRCAIVGGLYDRAAALMTSYGRELFARGAFKELRFWIDKLPGPLVRERPDLCVLHSWSLAYLGELNTAFERLASAESALQSGAVRMPDTSDGKVPVDAEVQVLRAALGVIRTDEPDVSGLTSDVVERFPDEDMAIRGFAYVVLGYASRAQGNLQDASGHFRSALEVSCRASSPLVYMLACFNLGTALFLMGRSRDAESSLRDGLSFARDRQWLHTMATAFVRVQLANLLCEQNRCDDALTELSEAIAVLESTSAFGFLGVALVEHGRTLYALGHGDQMAAVLARAREVAVEHGVSRVMFRADLLEARIAIDDLQLRRAENLLANANRQLSDAEQARRGPYSERYELLLIERVRLLLAEAAYGEAVRLAGGGLSSAAVAGRGRNRVEFLVLQAAAWQGLKRSEKAIAKLNQAVALASHEPIVRPFVLAGTDVLGLLRRLSRRRPDRGPVDLLLKALESRRDGSKKRVLHERPTIHTIHYRELQILKLLSQGLRNREIAHRLNLSEQTVKWYLRGLYERLGVHTRTHAIAVGRELGLLA